MSHPVSHPFPTTRQAAPGVRLAAGWSVAVVAASAAGAAALGVSPGVAALVTAVAAGLMLHGLARTPSASGKGFAACHRVTLLRAGLVGVLAGALAVPSLGWPLLAVALAALALDGLDGWLARRQGTASDFGARFDMEVDAALIAVLAGLAWAGGKAGVWVLALGLMRYGFVAAAWVWPWLAAPLPHSLRRKVVCVVQVAVLAVLMAPLLAPPATTALAAAALTALVWSFAVDVLWLWRGRPLPAPAQGVRP